MAIVETLALVLGAVVLLYFYFTRNHNYWAKRGVPFEKPWPIFGNFLNSALMKECVGCIMTRIYRKYDGETVVGIFFFQDPVLLIRDPMLAHQVLTSLFSNFANNSMKIDVATDPVMGREMAFQNGTRWKRIRQAISPGFSQLRVKGTFNKLLVQSDKLVQYIESNSECEVQSVFSLYTCEVVADAGIGIDAHSFTDKDPELPKLGKMYFDMGFLTHVKAFILFFIPNLNRIFKFTLAPKPLTDFFNVMMPNLIKQREANPEKRTDLLQFYIDLKKKRQIARSDEQHEILDEDIISGMVSFLAESYETTSTVASFLLQHLANDRKLQSRLRVEVDELFANGEPTYEETNEAPLLQRTLQETTRFYASNYFLKECSKSCEIDIGKGKKLFIEEGTSVVIPTQGIHTDPRYWENPLDFNPDRFLEDEKNFPKGTYLPFGDGPRICTGMRMSQAIIKIGVAKIIRNFEIVPTEKTSPLYVQDPTSTILPKQLGGYHMKFVKRSFN